MKISDDQIGKVIRYLIEGGAAAPVSSPRRISLQQDTVFVDSVIQHLAALPEVREERVRHLRANLAHYDVAPEEIAQKMIGRAIGDQLR